MLNVKNIHQYYGGSHILRDVSLQAHEGKVWARSKIGEGTVFVLRLRRVAVAENFSARLPVAKPQLLPQAGEAVAAAAGTGGRAHG